MRLKNRIKKQIGYILVIAMLLVMIYPGQPGSAAGETDGLFEIDENNVLIGYNGTEMDVEVEIPRHVTAIGKNAFLNNKDITSVTIPSSVTSIGDQAFLGCNSLQTVTVPSSVSSVGESVFYGCGSLDEVVWETSASIPDNTFRECSSLRTISLNKNIKNIGAEAFKDCTELENFAVPDGTTSIAEDAFDGCTAMTAFSVEENNIAYTVHNGVLYSKDDKELVRCPQGLYEVKLSENVKLIKSHAFYGCGFGTLTLPESVEYVKTGAFNSSKIEVLVLGRNLQEFGEQTPVQPDDCFADKIKISPDAPIAGQLLDRYTSEVVETEDVPDITGPDTEEPDTEKPDTEKPDTEQPDTEKPDTEKPSTEQPDTEKPSTEKPDTEKPDTEKPSTEKPSTEKPSTEKPNTEKPSTEKPNTEKPSTEKPNPDKPNKPSGSGDMTNVFEDNDTDTPSNIEAGEREDEDEPDKPNKPDKPSKPSDSEKPDNNNNNNGGNNNNNNNNGGTNNNSNNNNNNNNTNNGGNNNTNNGGNNNTNNGGNTNNGNNNNGGNNNTNNGGNANTGNNNGGNANTGNNNTNGGGSGTATAPTGVPYVESAPNVQGWDAIIKAMESAKEGVTATIVMNGTTPVKKEALEQVKEKSMILVLKMGNGIEWKILGKDITAAADLDMGVTLGSGSIPADLQKETAKENYSVQMHLAHTGDFGFTAMLKVNLGRPAAGKNSKLYYYNAGENKLEQTGESAVSTAGDAQYAFTHASDYLIVVEGVTPEQMQNTHVADNTPKTGPGLNTKYIFCLGVMLLGVYMILTSRKESYC